MNQAQILPAAGPHSIITLNYMANFKSKNIFYQTNIKEGQQVPWKIASLISNCIFCWKKNIFFAKFLWFLRFPQIQLHGGKIWDRYIFFWNISDFLTHMLTWVRIHIEMGNLEAKTPSLRIQKYNDCAGPSQGLKIWGGL